MKLLCYAQGRHNLKHFRDKIPSLGNPGESMVISGGLSRNTSSNEAAHQPILSDPTAHRNVEGPPNRKDTRVFSMCSTASCTSRSPDAPGTMCRQIAEPSQRYTVISLNSVNERCSRQPSLILSDLGMSSGRSIPRRPRFRSCLYHFSSKYLRFPDLLVNHRGM